MTAITWKGGRAFDAQPETGPSFVMDASPDHGGNGLGPSPFGTLLCATACCSAMDVISILEKKQQKVTSYRVEVEYEQGPEGEYPRPITRMKVKHVVDGENIDLDSVAKAVELSDQKYCSLIASLRANVDVKSVWEVASPAHAGV